MGKLIDFLKGWVIMSLVLNLFVAIAVLLCVFISCGVPETITSESIRVGIRACIVAGFLMSAMAVGME